MHAIGFMQRIVISDVAHFLHASSFGQQSCDSWSGMVCSCYAHVTAQCMHVTQLG